MKRIFTLVALLLIGAASLSAQIFEVAPWGDDNALAFIAHQNETGEWSLDMNQSVRLDKGFEFERIDERDRYYIFIHEGKHYGIYNGYLKFSSKNPDKAENPLSEKQQKRDSLLGWFYGSMAAVIVMVATMVIAALISLLHFKAGFPNRAFVLKVIPGAILLNSLILIYGQITFGSEIFWWCDYDRYGFFGSLFRVIPFVLALLVQICSIKIYERVLFEGQPEREDGTPLKLSIKPAALSLGLCLPITIGVALLLGGIGIRGLFMDLITTITFFVTLGWGMIKTHRKNVKLFGQFNGLMMTLFSSVYIIGVIIAGIALIALIFRLIFQILAVLATFFILAMMIPKRRYRGSDGRIYEEY